jgi:hypothetical protein
MQSQDGPPRNLRNVPGFRDLRTGSPKSWRSSFHRNQSFGERSDIYELLGGPGNYSSQTTTPQDSKLNLHIQAEDAKAFAEVTSVETIIGRHDVPGAERLAHGSGDTIAQQPCRRGAILKELRFPLFCIHGSMLLILGTLAVVVSVYRVKPDRGLFFEPAGFADTTQHQYILLSIPASMVFSCRYSHKY